MQNEKEMLVKQYEQELVEKNEEIQNLTNEIQYLKNDADLFINDDYRYDSSILRTPESQSQNNKSSQKKRSVKSGLSPPKYDSNNNKQMALMSLGKSDSIRDENHQQPMNESTKKPTNELTSESRKNKKKKKGKESTPKFSEVKSAKKVHIGDEDMKASGVLMCNICELIIVKNKQYLQCGSCGDYYHYECVKQQIAHPNKFTCENCEK